MHLAKLKFAIEENVMPFQYQPRSQESYETRANFRDGGSFDRMFDRDVVMFKPHAGENNIRILPPTWQNADHYGYDLYVHYGVGPDRGSYLSLWKHKGQPDPIDEAAAQAAKEGKDQLERELRWTRRVAIWLIDRAEPDKGPQLWLSPATSFDRDVIQQSRDRQTGEILAVDDPQHGYDIFFNKEGEKLATKYSGVSVARRPSPLNADPAIAERWLDYVASNAIPSMLKFYSYERISAVFRGDALSGGMEEVAPATQPQAETPPTAPAAAYTPPTAPTATPQPQTPPSAPTAAYTPPSAPVTQAQQQSPQAQPQPQTPPTAPAATPPASQPAAVPDLPPVPTRTRPTTDQQGFEDVPY